ncbi:unnamed protein product [Parajaminaea phylloscopi]
MSDEAAGSRHQEDTSPRQSGRRESKQMTWHAVREDVVNNALPHSLLSQKGECGHCSLSPCYHGKIRVAP